MFVACFVQALVPLRETLDPRWGAASPPAGGLRSNPVYYLILCLEVLPTSTTGACWERGTARWQWSWRTRRRWPRWWTSRRTKLESLPCSFAWSASSTETSWCVVYEPKSGSVSHLYPAPYSPQNDSGCSHRPLHQRVRSCQRPVLQGGVGFHLCA